MKHITQIEFAGAIAQGAVIVDYFAEWCPPCKALTPMLEQMQAQLGDKVTIYKVDVDAEQALAQQQGITAMPTLHFYKDGQLVEEVRGLDPQKIIAATQRLIAQ